MGLVTGARVKIGYQTALKMLRAGAGSSPPRASPTTPRVATPGSPTSRSGRTASTSTASTCATRRASRSSPATSSSSFDRLDILVNNACQTVRRPPGFYAHLLANESRPPPTSPPRSAALLASHQGLKARSSRAASLPAAQAVDSTGLMAWHGGRGGVGHHGVLAHLSQVRYSYDDATRRSDLFPDGRVDADLQQVDLARRTRWRLALADGAHARDARGAARERRGARSSCARRLKPLMLRTPRATSTS